MSGVWCAGGQALEGHADLELGREQRARLEAHQLGAVVAEGLLGFELHLGLEAGAPGRRGRPRPRPAGRRRRRRTRSASSSASMGRFWASVSVQVRLTTQGAAISMRDDRMRRRVPSSNRGDGSGPPAAAARRPVAGALHAPPLAEEAAAGAPGLARRAAAAVARGAVRAGRRRTASSRGWCSATPAAWRLRHGPAAAARAAAAVATRGWTLLVQGLDLHVPAAHAMLAALRLRARMRGSTT